MFNKLPCTYSYSIINKNCYDFVILLSINIYIYIYIYIYINNCINILRNIYTIGLPHSELPIGLPPKGGTYVRIHK